MNDTDISPPLYPDPATQESELFRILHALWKADPSSNEAIGNAYTLVAERECKADEDGFRNGWNSCLNNMPKRIEPDREQP